MRNLNLIDKKAASCSFLKDCCAATIERNLMFFANQNELCKLDVDQPNAEDSVEVLGPLDVGSVLDLKYLPEEDVLAIVAKIGSVSVYNLSSSEFDVVGDVAGGISGCCWSPDMETLVIISETGNVLMMSRTWDVIQEAPLFQQDFGEAKFVSVGWGSKETQFHGSEGKDARSKKQIDCSLADWDDRATRIVWRADGLFFAVNAVEPNTGHRLIRVFNREGFLQSTSEPVSQLCQSLSWRSSGASGLITSTVSLVQQGKQQVAFFEKNGLRHGEFDFPVGQQVLESYWNGDSTILAMIIRFDQDVYGLQLWTMANYHWYMKHFCPFEKGLRPLWVMWDVIETNRLHIIVSNGTYVMTDYQPIVTSSTDLTSSDPACIAVVDNCKLKITFLRESIVPPPMCGWEIEFSSSIHSVDLLSSFSSRLSVLTHSGLVHFFRFTDREIEEKLCHPDVKIVCKEGGHFRPVLDFTASLSLPVNYQLYHFRLVNPSTIVSSALNQLLVLELNETIFTIKDTITLDTRIGGIEVLRRQQNTVLIHLVDGKLLELHTDDMKISDSVVFPEFCCRMEWIDGHVVGLAASGRLYVDGKEILSAVSSFVAHSHFLLMTSLQKHRLLCLPLSGLSNPNLAITERAIERGAKLVHAVAMETTVILQMPRGNLEAIHPRALSLNIMKSLIDKQSYSDAFVLMKKQRINLNLLYDHNPSAFLEHCLQFVEQVSSVDVANLNLFLGELQDEDFTTTMYQSHYENKSTPKDNGKVNTVCSRIREVMIEKDSLKYLLPIITSYIKQAMVDQALKRVQVLTEESLKDQALKYMAVLVDGEQLYKEALATYDLQLTLMVAHRSQKDPKEYLAFLNDLKAMADDNERRFTIDNSLKCYDSAIRHLCRCRPVRTEQIIAYMKLHRTYVSVVDELCTVLPKDVVKTALQAAACLQAEILASRDNHEEAGYLYQRVEAYDLALHSFEQCGMWANCLSLASKLQLNEVETKSLVSKLVTRLRSSKKHGDAAQLAEYHLGDYQLAGQCLIDGLFFREAWALAYRHNIVNWAETTLKNELNEAFQLIEAKLEQVEQECCKYSQRLSVVRQDLLYKRDHPPAETDHGDLYSETGSSIFTHSTGTSGRTFRSSKNRRKQERKKLRLKEGSPFEDMAIINELHVLYSSISTVLQDVGRLLRGELIISKDWSRAKCLQNKTESLLRLMEEKKKDIWNFSLNQKNQESDKNFGPSATTEMIISQVNQEKEEFFSTRYLELDIKIRSQPDSPDTTWKLDSLK
ncbi:hypothetical protein OUZ56_025220 [Daphnia magna]|uniref:Elongator complex protein 1 n=1 Tax=Daphnia magna TaxID=35525 RepID=A0ABQ9ZJ80_9CRUS|nr:hypothetical protein OUZ56_025220 [Daphnia magna]